MERVKDDIGLIYIQKASMISDLHSYGEAAALAKGVHGQPRDPIHPWTLGHSNTRIPDYSKHHSNFEQCILE